jgi:hypothetical protein
MNTSSIATAILVAIAAIALLIPGLNALNESIIGMRESKKKESAELCYATVARQRTEPARLAEKACIAESNLKIDNNFKPALDMIGSFKEALALNQ